MLFKIYHWELHFPFKFWNLGFRHVKNILKPSFLQCNWINVSQWISKCSISFNYTNIYFVGWNLKLDFVWVIILTWTVKPFTDCFVEGEIVPKPQVFPSTNCLQICNPERVLKIWNRILSTSWTRYPDFFVALSNSMKGSIHRALICYSRWPTAFILWPLRLFYPSPLRSYLKYCPKCSVAKEKGVLVVV